jgi:hypothetical protein
VLQCEQPNDIDAVCSGEFQIYQGDIDGVDDAEFEHVSLTIGDTNDIQTIVFAEEMSQPEGEELFGRNHHDRDPGSGQRGPI